MTSASDRAKAASPRSLSGLLPFLRPYRGRIAAAVVFLVAAAVTTLAFPVALRSLIDGGSVDGEAPAWDAPVNSQQATGSLNKDLDSLTIESMLACWARDPDAFERANMRVQDYLDLILDGSYTEQQHEMERLQELRSIWNTLTTELLEK